MLLLLLLAGNTQQSKVVHSAKHTAYFGATFEWPVARQVEPEECVLLQLYNHNKYLNNKYAHPLLS